MPTMDTLVSTVTVYPDRARVKRTGAQRLESGTQVLEIPGLPLQMNPDSLRTTARGTARARLLGVQVQRAFFSETPTEKVRQLEESIEGMQDDLKRLEMQATTIDQARNALLKIMENAQTFALALASGEMNLEKQMALIEGFQKRLNGLNSEQQGLAAQRRELERKLQKAIKDLEQLRSARPPERYVARVEVEVIEAGELTVELDYVVSGAGWKPLYDLRLQEQEGEAVLEIGYLAQVMQKTSEAWENVSLSLSTARPALARTIPELQPWLIRPPTPPQVMRAASAPAPQMARMKAAAPMGGNQAAFGMPAAEPVMEAEAVEATVESSGSAVTYVIPGSVSIPPDGAAHKVTVSRFSLAPRLDYVAAPKLVQAVYRRAKVNNDSPYTLLPGEANLFAGDEFIGTTPLEMTAPQGEIELYLGVEDRIKIERELKRREVDKRLIGGKRHLAYAYEIKLENLLPAPAVLTLHDQIPIAAHEEIKVKLESAEPKPTEPIEMGLLKWELSLEGNSKRTVRFEFSVETPQAMQVVGLP